MANDNNGYANIETQSKPYRERAAGIWQGLRWNLIQHMGIREKCYGDV